jgi:hypothetical protein
MKPSKTWGIGSLLAMALLLASPPLSWSTRAVGQIVTGQVSSMPASGQIEVDHLVYRVRAGTSADKNLRKFHMGQRVDLELDGPVAAKGAQVVSIAVHSGTGGAND